MSRAIAHLLVHGYLGAASDLAALTAALPLGANDALEILTLPGHGGTTTPAFDESVTLDALAAAIDRQLDAGRQLVLIGHSTGGCLLLTELARRRERQPDSLDAVLLLVLCATPPQLDLGYAQRWAAHLAERGARHAPALHDIGALAGCIRRLARRKTLALAVPVLAVHGEDDELVPIAALADWRSQYLGAPLRRVGIAGARHHLFLGPGAALVTDIIVRAVADARRRGNLSRESPALLEQWPESQTCSAAWPDSLMHLVDAPAGRLATGRPPVLAEVTDNEPTLANIEITTRCTLGCAACARTQMKLKSRHMSEADFRRVLATLPHARRLVLVGLGEPLLHPQVLDFIRIAVADGRRVGLVTNAMQLDAEMASGLLDAGLARLTFSLDAIDPSVAERVRSGSDMGLIRANILAFMAEKRRRGVALGAAAFTALGADNLGELPAIVDFALEAGLDALMLSDLNFPANQTRALHATLSREQAAALRQTLRQALARGLPVLSVWGLEEYALERRYLDFLLLDGRQAAQRGRQHRHCSSPWQSIPVNVDGQVTVCDCQPRAVLGNLFSDPLPAWWNGPAMRTQRQRMLGDNPPADCLSCPRF
jgi:MoaA/NifB/PqqE/SkfB family radical SAM enzyme/alpha-beta hydrolase superfamily lysophospholipase